MDAGGKISFIGMEEGEPVFRAESAAGGVILYLDGDLVESMIEENEELSLKLSVRNIGAQVHMMWDGGTTLTTPGYRVVLPGTPSWYEIGFDPCIFRTDGIERGEGKDLYLWFNGGNKLEFKGLSLTAAESETE